MQARAFLRLARFQTAPLTALAPVMGASLSAGFSPGRDTALFCAGLCCHVFGFVHNELCDRDVDRLAPDLAAKPLVAGSVSPQAAAWTCGAAWALALALMAALSLAAAAITMAAVAAAFLYNRCSKRVAFADWSVAITMGLLVLAGGAAAGALAPLAWIVAGLLTVQLLVQNTLAHLKDLEQDQAAGGTNAALRLGVCRVGDCVLTTASFRGYVVALRALHLVAAAVGVWLLPSGRIVPAALALALTQAAALHAFHGLVQAPPADRGAFLQLFFRHEMPTLLAVTVLLVGALGWGALLPYVVLPLAWARVSLRLLHHGEMPAL